MKRILLALILCAGLLTATYAQTATPASSSQTTASEQKKASGVTKSGKPDMRFKANKEAAKAQQQQPAETKTEPVAPVAAKAKTVTNPAIAPNPNPAPVAPVAAKTKTVVTNPTVAPNPNPAPVQHNTTAQNVQPVKAATATTSDQTIGTDAKGRTLYRGKRGGTYYINKNGNKEYEKQQ